MNDPLRLQLLKQISLTDQADELRGLRDQVHEQIRALLLTRPIEQLNEQLNEVHDAVIRRVIMLSEVELARLGIGSPPVPYAYILFGSGGRKEQTLSSDQDSGVVYEDPVTNKEGVSLYFQQLSKCIVHNLQRAGYPPCEGNVISNNPEWCMSLSDWGKRLNRWFEEPDWEAVRYLLIIADGRLVYGEERMAGSLKDLFFRDTLNHPIIIRRMIENTMRHKILVGVFGQLLKEPYGEDAGSLDIKYGAYIPMVNSIRMMAIDANIRETSTLERIYHLVESGKLSEKDGELYNEAFRLFLRLRLMTTEQSENGLFTSNGKLHSSRMSKEMTDKLKSSLRLGRKLQRTVYKQTMGRLMQ